MLKKGDMLVVTKLNRFVRSAVDRVNLINELLSKKSRFTY
ncbi:hypothetical protein FQ087_08820 [Sporosarcina sp. ANT_H38]|nr:hypothetical protein FQ087_08820 [Sporosarcina sp. ANT_H38]